MENTRTWFNNHQNLYSKEICANCNSKENLTLHHIVPLIKGGTNNVGNVVCLCGDCHGIVHGKGFGEDHKALTIAGLEKARASGKQLGRPCVLKVKPENWNEIIEAKNSGAITTIEAAKLLNISKSTFLRRLKEWS